MKYKTKYDSDIFNKIWSMQHELNLKVGKDTIFDEKKHEMLFMYCLALNDEIIELLKCYDIVSIKNPLEGVHYAKYEIIEKNFKNAKIEIIDSLHFLISIFHILDIKFENNNPIIMFENIEKEYNKSVYSNIYLHIMNLLFIVNKIMNRTNWKWWSKSVKENPNSQYKLIFNYDNINQDCEDALKTLFIICYYLNMNLNDIFEIYKLKWEVNCERQNTNYDVKTKDEKDNLSIEEKI